MDMDRFPSVTEVRACPPGELAVWLSTMSADAVCGLPVDAAEAVVVATQRVSSWMFGLQAVAVDRFAQHVLDAQDAHASDLMAARDALRESVEASGGVWRGDRGAIALPEPEQIAASMLAPELRISPRTMRTRLNRSRSLMELPTTLGLALSGDLEPWRVDAVVAAAADVGAEKVVEFETRLYAGDVSALPKPRLRERARGAAGKADPECVARGEARAPRRRCLRVGPSQDTAGVMRWTADIPDELSRRMFAAIDALAQEYLAADREAAASGSTAGAGAGAGAGADGAGSAAKGRRTVDQSRLDALGDLVLGNAHIETVVDLLVPVATGTHGTTATAGSQTPAAGSQTAPAATPAAAAPASFVDRRDARAAAEATFGATARRGSARGGGGCGGDGEGGGDAVIIDLVLGSVTRDTLAAGRLERTHGLALGGWLETEDNPFLAHHPPPDAPPGTSPPTPPTPLPPATRCHLDHVTAYPDGATIEANLQTLCPAHHGFKHHAGWTVTMTPDGTCTWATPAGRTHTTTPPNPYDTAA